MVAGDCHLAHTAITEQTGETPIHPLQLIPHAYCIPDEDERSRSTRPPTSPMRAPPNATATSSAPM